MRAIQDRVPSSFVSTARGAQMIVGLAGALVLLEVMLLGKADEAWLWLLAAVPPILMVGAMIAPIVRRDAPTMAKIVLAALAGHVTLVLYIALTFGLLSLDAVLFVGAGIAILFTVTVIAASPLLLAAAMLGPRDDHEAGDAMLGWGGAWLVALQAGMLYLLLETSHSSAAAPSIVAAVVGVAVGLLAIATFAARAIARRLWCARAVRGELQGWRVREQAADEELATLPPIFGARRELSRVLERIEMGGMLYRSGVVASPVALVRAERSAAHCSKQ